MKVMRLFFLSLLAMVLTACGGEGSGLPSQPDQPVTMQSLQLTPVKATIPVGWTQQYTVEVLFSDGHTLDVTKDPRIRLHSSDTNIATIDSNGLANGVTPGEVTITATGTDGTTVLIGNATLVVTDATVVSINVTPTQATVPVGITQQYEAIAILSDGRHFPVTAQPSITWYSSDDNLATINNGAKKGMATGNNIGEVDITATGRANGKEVSGSAKLYVTDAEITKLTVTPPSATVPRKLIQAYDAIALFSDNSTRTITNDPNLNWSVRDSNIATIDNLDNKGVATGVSTGTTAITATWQTSSQTLQADAALTVVRFPTNLGLEVSPEQTVVEGASTPFRAWVISADGSRLSEVTKLSALSWQSHDPQIGSIQSTRYSTKGWATGNSEGTTNIIAALTIEQQPLSGTSSLIVTKPSVQLRIAPQNLCIAVNGPNEYDFGYAQFRVEVLLASDPVGTWTDISDNPDLIWSIETEDEVERSRYGITALNIGNSYSLAPGTVRSDLAKAVYTSPIDGMYTYTLSKHWAVATYTYNGQEYKIKTLVGAYVEGNETPLTGNLEGYAPSCPEDLIRHPG
jgi:hypothetical protein